MLKRIFSQATALGVGKIFITNANRVEKSFWESGILDPIEYRPHLIQGLEQAIDTRLPEIIISRHFRSFAEEKLRGIAGDYSHLLLAHPKADKSLSTCLQGKRGRVLYAINLTMACNHLRRIRVMQMPQHRKSLNQKSPVARVHIYHLVLFLLSLLHHPFS